MSAEQIDDYVAKMDQGQAAARDDARIFTAFYRELEAGGVDSEARAAICAAYTIGILSRPKGFQL